MTSFTEYEYFSCSLLTGEEDNVTPRDKFGGETICRSRKERSEVTSVVKKYFSHVSVLLGQILLFSVYASARIHTPLMATTTSIAKKKRFYDFASVSLESSW